MKGPQKIAWSERKISPKTPSEPGTRERSRKNFKPKIKKARNKPKKKGVGLAWKLPKGCPGTEKSGKDWGKKGKKKKMERSPPLNKITLVRQKVA